MSDDNYIAAALVAADWVERSEHREEWDSDDHARFELWYSEPQNALLFNELTVAGTSSFWDWGEDDQDRLSCRVAGSWDVQLDPYLELDEESGSDANKILERIIAEGRSIALPPGYTYP